MKTISLREIIMFIACLIMAFFLFVKKWNNAQLEQDKSRIEERIKTYQQNEKYQHRISDSLKKQTKALETIIEHQNKNPKIIIRKYEIIRNNVNRMDADQSIQYLSKRLSIQGDNK